MIRNNYFKSIEIFLLLPVMVISYIYDYSIFENFEITKASFVKEQKIVKELEQIRNNLYQREDVITYGLNALHLYEAQFDNNPLTEKLLSFQIKDLVKNTSFKNNTDYSFWFHSEWKNSQGVANNFNFHYNISAEKIMNGASKGIMMIHETYDLDISEFAKGYLNLRNGIEANCREIDSLQPDDLASMSSMAFSIHWYDTSLKYLKECIKLFRQLSEEKKSGLPDDFENTILQMRKSYSKYHNIMLMKKQKKLGPDWKLFPYIVDEGLNLKFSDYISMPL